MNIEKVKIELLKPSTYNPRKDLKPGDPEYEKLKRSIDEFDYIEPIIWNKTTGNVIGGHQRLKILKEKGLEEIEVVVVEFDETKEKLANLALNKISGDWDFVKMADLLQEIDTGAIDITMAGFDLSELEKIALWNQPLPEDIPNVDILGESLEKTKYLVITFSNEGEFEAIKNLLELGKTKRTIDFSVVKEKLNIVI